MRWFPLVLVAVACGARQQLPPPRLDPPAFRLPREVRPVAYAVDLTLTPGERRFAGSVDIDVELAGPTRVIWLHASGLEVARATVSSQPARVHLAKPSWLGLEVSEPVSGRARLSISYTGAIEPELGRGIFQNRLGADAYLYTQFEGRWARNAFPCFDEPGFKVPWTLTLRVPEGQVAAANTRVDREEHVAGRHVIHFKRTQPLPSYLVAFAVGPFEVVDGGTAGRGATPLRALVPRGRSAEAAPLLATLPRLLDHFEEYMAISYPYDKLDAVAVIGHIFNATAMENAGLITCAVDVMLPGKNDTPSFRRGLTSIMAHEVAHQWFGDLVTPAWWDDLWLNESFASWLGDKVLRAVDPTASPELDIVEEHSSAMAQDLEPDARPLHRPVESDFAIEDVDGLVYDKGQAVLDMLDSWLGPDVVRQGVRDHIASHAHGVATAADFAAALARASRKDVAGVLASYTEQPGVPLVEGELVCDAAGARARLRQRPERAPGDAASTLKWNIPICLRHGSAGRDVAECFVLTEREAEHRLEGGCPEWIAWNANHSAYYLTAGAAVPRLFASRAQLSRSELLGGVADLVTLVGNGSFPIGDALRATEPILASNDAEARLLIVGLDEHATTFAGKDLEDRLRRRIRDRYASVVVGASLAPHPGEARLARRTRQEIVAFEAAAGDDRNFAPEADELARRFLATGTGMDWTDRRTILPLAATWGSAAFFDVVKEAVGRAAPAEVRRLVALFGRPADAALLRSNYAWVLAQDKVASPNLVELLRLRSDNTEAQWALIEENLDPILARLPEDLRADSMGLGASICDASDRARFVKLFAERSHQVKDGDQTYQEMTAHIDQCIAIRAVQEPSLRAWLGDPNTVTGR